MREANKRSKAGQEIRLADIPADAGKGLGLFENLHHFDNGSELANALNHGVGASYGTAGIAWLETLTDIISEPGKIYYFKKLQQKFMEEVLPAKASSQIVRVASRMGLIAAAGEYATNIEITNWPSTAAMEGVKECFAAWLEQRGGIDNQEVFQALSQVRAFFEANGESQFTAWDEAGKTQFKTRDRVGFSKVNDQGQTEYYVFTEAYERRICQGLNKRDVTKLLAEKGWLKLDRNEKPYQTVRFPEIGLAKCYVFSGKLWEGG